MATGDATTTGTGETVGGSISAESGEDIFVTGVRNAHAVEKEARQILSRQIERLENYPEVTAFLKRHLEETNRHEEAIDKILDELGTGRSVIKDWATQLMGNAAAIAHAPAGDEIIKNMLANHAFENFEVAAYTSLIAVAKATGYERFVPVLEGILRDEENAARTVKEQIGPVTRTYVRRATAGQKADR